LLFVISTFLVLALGEVLCRFYIPYSDDFWQPNQVFGWGLVPGYKGLSRGENTAFAEINPKGLRDYEYGYEKDAGTFRILVLGDSFCEAIGLPLEEAFHKRLEKKLNDKVKGPKVEVINTGVSGFGTDNELLFCIHEGYKYDPDLVLLVFNVGNDISDNSHNLAPGFPKPYFVLEGDKLKHVPYVRIADDHPSLRLVQKVFFARTPGFIISSIKKSENLLSLIRCCIILDSLVLLQPLALKMVSQYPI